MEEIRLVKIKIKEIENILDEMKSKITDSCEHRFIQEMSDGPRDNGEFYLRCTYCGLQK